MRTIEILFIIILFSTMVVAQEKSNYISKIDFDPVGAKNLDGGEIFSTYSELKIWAYYQGWNLDPDYPFAGIQNGIARMIPPSGLNQVLWIQSKEKETVFLHLEITRFTPGNLEFLRPNVLKIYVNGRLRETLEIFGRKNFQNPVVIGLDPSEFPDGRINIDLVPVSNNLIGKFWGVWDIFLSFRKDIEK